MIYNLDIRSNSLLKFPVATWPRVFRATATTYNTPQSKGFSATLPEAGILTSLTLMPAPRGKLMLFE